MLAKIVRFPHYPVLLMVQYPLLRISTNLDLFHPASVVRPLLLGAATVLLALGLAAAVLRDRHRAAFAVALLVGFILYYEPFRGAINQGGAYLFGFVFREWVTVLVGLALFGLLSWFIRPGVVVTQVANLSALAMVCVPLVGLLNAGAVGALAAPSGPGRAVLASRWLAAPPLLRPSIVHVVLDGYSRADVLTEVYGHDNTEFLDDLRSLGFAVADRATTPYNQTLMVMSSVLHGAYLDELGLPDPTSPTLPRLQLSQSIAHNPVFAALGRLGYTTATVPTEYEMIDLQGATDVVLRSGWLPNDLETWMFDTSLLGHVFGRIRGSGEMIRQGLALPPAGALSPPFLLYIHVLAPHWPFDIDRHGRSLPPAIAAPEIRDRFDVTRNERNWRRDYVRGYVEKLRFLNGQVLAFLRGMIERSSTPLVILLHGDHGGDAYYVQHNLARSCPRERFSPLLAVYSTDGHLQAALPGDFNLVNLYRLVFGTYFGADLPLLSARSFYVDWTHVDRARPLSPAQLEGACAAEAAIRSVAPPGAADR